MQPGLTNMMAKLAKAEQERATILQNRRINRALQTALERGELFISPEGWLEKHD